MNGSPKAFLKEVEYPVYSTPEKVGPAAAGELALRIGAVCGKMEERGLSHLVVYGDREHFANIHYLSGFDPRFEEALLVIRPGKDPLILVGNEGEGHLGISSLYLVGRLRHLKYTPFSLMDQPRDTSVTLEEIFRSEGIGKGSRVGVVGWKYYHADGFADALHVSDIPAYIWNILQTLAGSPAVTNATDLLISPEYGLRAFLSADEIALYEYSNIMGSECVKSVLSEIRDGETDFDILKKAGFTGYPFSCHPSIKSSGNLHYSLTSPTGDAVRKGSPGSISVAYRGSNICRAGWIARDGNDLPAQARGYVENFAGPYFYALKEWLANLKIGTEGGRLYSLIQELLPFGKFQVSLNPGHLIHDDEWLSTPVSEGSGQRLKSGMYIQSDIIPRSPVYSSARMEEGYVLADNDLRSRLRKSHPAVYTRCSERRSFMESLGFELPEEVLPLSNMAGIMVPYFLDRNKIMTLI